MRLRLTSTSCLALFIPRTVQRSRPISEQASPVMLTRTSAAGSFPTCCHFEFWQLHCETLPCRRVRRRALKLSSLCETTRETYVFREFARLPGLCNFVAPQYAQTNPKQAQRIKARGRLGLLQLLLLFSTAGLKSFKPFMQNHHYNIFFASRGTNTVVLFTSLTS